MAKSKVLRAKELLWELDRAYVEGTPRHIENKEVLLLRDVIDSLEKKIGQLERKKAITIMLDQAEAAYNREFDELCERYRLEQ